jgi:hypothetical protein
MPTDSEIKKHKEYLKANLKKNFYWLNLWL